jgi:arylsulfatase
VSESFLVKGQLKAAAFLETFVDYPPSQRPASFNVEGVRKQVDRKIDEAFKKRGIE